MPHHLMLSHDGLDIFREIKATAAPRAGDIFRRIIVDDFNGLLAMQTLHLHSVRPSGNT